MAGEDKKYADWLKRQPCCACLRTPCGEHHHATGAGMGLRGHDHTAMPMCPWCHTDFHFAAGQFRSWGKEFKREWQRVQYEHYRAVYLGQSKAGPEEGS